MAKQTVDFKPKKKILWSARKRLWCGLPWTFTVYSLSEDRLFVKSGMLSIREDEVRLYRVRDLGLKRSFIQRIFGLGTIVICSTDSSMRDFELKNIRDCESVKERLSELVEDERQRKRVATREILNHGADDDNDNDFDDFDHMDVDHV
ncbi:MAG: PH domain-containing protein [Lachnospiraceae bacterium]|nr:PH domain-containing protein [Lachnospiraceae bacterium]